MHRHNAPRAKAGYSLLEILIVLTIIALIAALVGPRLFAQLDRSKVTTARVQVRALETALATMRLDLGRDPTQAEGLDLLVKADRNAVAGWSGPYLSGGLPLDPWGHPYVYQAPSDDQQPAAVTSLGSDGKVGGTGNAADIQNKAGV
jgi:general secretion pathway protein G